VNDRNGLRRKAAIVASTLAAAAATFIGIRALSQTEAVGGYPSLVAPFTFDGDYDAGCQVLGGEGGWDRKEWNTDYPGTVTISTTRHQEGNCSAEYSTPAGPNPNYVDNPLSRAEVQAPVYTAATITGTWETLLYIPSEANHGPYYSELTQPKNQNAHCYTGGLRLARQDQHLEYVTVGSCGSERSFDMGAVPRDHWFGVKVTEKLADAGSIHVWLDPDGTGPLGYVEKVPLTSADTNPAGGTVAIKLRQGLYHREDQHESHVYGDGFHFVRTN
jgi:hypothetical protein